jgi:transcriptional regulator with PAS, ATPase and Fis domain
MKSNRTTRPTGGRSSPKRLLPEGLSLHDYIAQVERNFIERALTKHGTVKGAARELRIKAPTLYKKMQTYGVTAPRTQRSEARRSRQRGRKTR